MAPILLELFNGSYIVGTIQWLLYCRHCLMAPIFLELFNGSYIMFRVHLTKLDR